MDDDEIQPDELTEGDDGLPRLPLVGDTVPAEPDPEPGDPEDPPDHGTGAPRPAS